MEDPMSIAPSVRDANVDRPKFPSSFYLQYIISVLSYLCATYPRRLVQFHEEYNTLVQTLITTFVDLEENVTILGIYTSADKWMFDTSQQCLELLVEIIDFFPDAVDFPNVRYIFEIYLQESSRRTNQGLNLEYSALLACKHQAPDFPEALANHSSHVESTLSEPECTVPGADDSANEYNWKEAASGVECPITAARMILVAYHIYRPRIRCSHKAHQQHISTQASSKLRFSCITQP
ncbi:hypothetical protein CVT24_008292 [Panaeolus cyanescens]|uniref:Uncharacterized protein n=1 Tax=Panaeolus cyanescens TaxID=181874 RepID=A0A409W0M3_9AGAR|nr:hypothetical protein CVT24_008292 [Panaeolus cyanescens]